MTAGDTAAAILEADPQAVFLIDAALRVRHENSRALALRSSRRLFRADGERLAGQTNRVDVQLKDAVQAVLKAPAELPPAPFQAWDKPRYTVELRRLGVEGDPLVLVRVFEGYAAPDASGEIALAFAERHLNPIHRRFSADGKHGPLHADPRAPLPPLEPLLAFEAYGRLGAMIPAAQERATWPTTISRHVRMLEALTRRSLVQGSLHRMTLTPAGRQLARALTDAFDILEAAVRPRPAGKPRGRKPKERTIAAVDQAQPRKRARTRTRRKPPDDP